jgi:hypothetical protein
MRAARPAFAARHLPLRSRASVASTAFISLSARRYVTSGNVKAPLGTIARLLDWEPQEEVRGVVVNGFIRSVRSMKSRCFVALGDGSSLASLQALVPTSQAEGCASFSPACCLGLTPLMLTLRSYLVSPLGLPFVSPGPGLPPRAPGNLMSSRSTTSKSWVLLTLRCIAVPLAPSLQAC